MRRVSRFSPEVRERAIRLVFDQKDEHGSQWAAICSIPSKIGCTAQTLRQWVAQSEKEKGLRDSLTTTER